VSSGHVSAITVAPSYRRLSLARELMKLIETVSEQQACYFVDLFVRVSNSLAISMYEHFGYSVYQRVVRYYSGGGVGDNLNEEDAFGLFSSL
jgi:N-terminal acetyltransferase B complex catalytic subunit